MARPEGFEPPTTWFVARYSIQLSYGRVKASALTAHEAAYYGLTWCLGPYSRPNIFHCLAIAALERSTNRCPQNRPPSKHYTAFREALNASALHDAHQIALAMLERSGDATDAHMDMTDVLLAMGEARRAKRHITISLKQGGTNPRVMTQLGAARGALWDTKGACEAFRQVVDMTPHDAEVWANLANALLRNGDVAAEQAITTALSLDDEHATFKPSPARLRCTRRTAKAGNHLSEAVRLAPDDLETRCKLGLQHLACDFETGWSLHEFGLKAPQRQLEHSIEVWSGESLTNKTLYIAAEQGVGDEVMFAECLPELITSHPNTRILWIAPALTGHFSALVPKYPSARSSRFKT